MCGHCPHWVDGTFAQQLMMKSYPPWFLHAEPLMCRNFRGRVETYCFLCNRPRDERRCPSCDPDGDLRGGPGLSHLWGKQAFFFIIMFVMTPLNKHTKLVLLNCFAWRGSAVHMFCFSGIPGPGGRGRQHQTGPLAQRDQHHPAGWLKYHLQSLLTTVIRELCRFWLIIVGKTHMVLITLVK